MKPPTLDRKALAVPSDFSLPWNTTRTMADVWAKKISRLARKKAERAELRRLANTARGSK